MEKETVLEIEFIQVWDKWAWRITKWDIEEDYLEHENCYLSRSKQYNWYFFGNRKIFSCQSEITTISSKRKEMLEELIKNINEKYGKPKRWRAERNRGYYYIDDDGGICYTTDDYVLVDNDRYALGNYFQTREQAEKALERVKRALQEVEENVEM